MSMDKDLDAMEQMADYLYDVGEYQETFSGSFMRTRALDIKVLVQEVRTLRSKVRSGVEAAHDAQRDYMETEDDPRMPWLDKYMDRVKRASASRAADNILEAMEEPGYERVKDATG